MFYDQLSSLCKNEKMTPTAFVTEKLGLSSSKITAWKNGSIPKYSTLKEISRYFNVPISFLFFEKDEESTFEQRLLIAFRKLTEDGQKAVLMFAEVSAENPQYQKYTNISKEA